MMIAERARARVSARVPRVQSREFGQLCDVYTETIDEAAYSGFLTGLLHRIAAPRTGDDGGSSSASFELRPEEEIHYDAAHDAPADQHQAVADGVGPALGAAASPINSPPKPPLQLTSSILLPCWTWLKPLRRCPMQCSC